MLREDFIMRSIKEAVRGLLKMLFDLDVEEPSADLLEDREDRKVLEEILGLVDAGEIDEAENRIYDLTDGSVRENLKLGLIFYAYLNKKEEEFLDAHDFSREEIKQGVEDLMERYGQRSMADIYL